MRGGRMKLRFDAFQVLSLIFIVYTAYTATWAINPGDSIQMAITLAQTVICASVLYWHYWGENIDSLLSAIKWAGYIVALYTIFFFGVDAVKAATQSGRLENAFANINMIGMRVALACVIQGYEVIYKRARLSSLLLTIPSLYVISATQSRKAILLLCLGILGVFLLKNINNKNVVRALGKGAIALALTFTTFYFLSSMPMFEGVAKRMEGVVGFVSGEGKVDGSTLIRQSMIELGWESFKKNPIGGIGIGCPHILAARELNFDAYLHNNYIELLCGGGVLGFAAYYLIYIYLLVNLFKYRNSDSRFFVFGVTWIFLLLLMDYAMVSYYDKGQVYYFAFLCLIVEDLKRKDVMEKRDNERGEIFCQSL